MNSKRLIIGLLCAVIIFAMCLFFGIIFEYHEYYIDILINLFSISAIIFYSVFFYEIVKEKIEKRKKDKERKILNNHKPSINDELIIKKDFIYSPSEFTFDDIETEHIPFKKGEKYKILNTIDYGYCNYVTIRCYHILVSFKINVNEYWTTKSLKRLERIRKIKKYKLA